MKKIAIFKEFFAFLRQNKAWWMMPMFLILVSFSFLIIFAEGSALAPFIYTLF